jgi:hypothetical protein
MPIHLENKDLIKPRQLEVAVHGPDGATHLILCTGVADLRPTNQESFTFCVGPQLSRRQFVGAIASCALATIQTHEILPEQKARKERGTNLVLIDADYDDEARQVKVTVEVPSVIDLTKLAISYHVSILAELVRY